MRYNTLLPLLFICVVYAANGQRMFERGTIAANAFFSFSAGGEKSTLLSGEDYKKISLDMNPSFAYYILDDLALTGGISLSTNVTQNKTSGFESRNIGIGFGPGIRYYLGKGPFVQSNCRWGSNKTTTTLDDTETSTTNRAFEWRLGFGYSFRISETVLFDVIPAFNRGSWKNRDTDEEIKYSNFSIIAGFNILLNK